MAGVPPNGVFPEWSVLARLFGRDEAAGPTQDDLDAFKGLLDSLPSEETDDMADVVFGKSFISIVSAAPREFATVTLLTHVLLAVPPIACGLFPLLRDPHHVAFLDGVVLRRAFRSLFDPLAPHFAGANHQVCEFRGMTAASWHETASDFGIGALEVARASASAARQDMETRSSRPERSEDLSVLTRTLCKRRPDLADPASVVKVVSGIGSIILGRSEFEKRYEGQYVNEVRGLAIRMQQELPRAWSLKYGTGNTGYVRLEEAILSVIETYAAGGRACAPRNRLFIKWKDEEGLGDAAIRDRWNTKSLDERKGIALRASGKVTREAVTKAIKRERSRQRKQKR